MDRKAFIRQCAYACGGAFFLSLTAESCSPVKYLQVTAENGYARVLKSEFTDAKSGKQRSYVIVKVSGTDYPVALYRVSEHEFNALLMRCPHQGSELNVNGNVLTCPAHGSEFASNGQVLQGPADRGLHPFPVKEENESILIRLI